MAWFYMQAMGNSTERIMVFDNIWNFDEDMLYDATVTLARTKFNEKNETILNLKKLVKSQFKDHIHLYTWANELYEKVGKIEKNIALTLRFRQLITRLKPIKLKLQKSKNLLWFKNWI